MVLLLLCSSYRKWTERRLAEARRHRITQTLNYKTELHDALLLGYTKDTRSQSNQTQEVGAVINPMWCFLTSSETETQLPKMPCPKITQRDSRSPDGEAGTLAQVSAGDYGP